jgi:hypothetical protein
MNSLWMVGQAMSEVDVILDDGTGPDALVDRFRDV